MFTQFDYHQQETGYNCGPSCILMAYRAIGGKELGIKHFNTITGCCPTIGTLPDGMIRGFDSVDIEHERIFGGYDEAIKHLEHGGLVIFRTLTHGIKHWILCYGYECGVFKIADPAFGIIEYDHDELEEIWAPRDYDAFLIKKKRNIQ